MESDLPSEMLSYILSFLEPCQRLSAGLVSKRWLEASSTQLEDVCLNLKELPKALTRNFTQITFTLMNIDDECIKFLDRNGPTLLHLSFDRCLVVTQKKTSACLHLRTLETTCSQALLIFVALPCLRNLNMHAVNMHVVELTDLAFKYFDKIETPKIELFAMPDKVFFNEDYDKEPNVIQLMQPSFTLERFVKSRATTIKTLRFPCTITPQAALRFSRMPGLKLRSVSFAYCSKSVAQIFPEFFKHQPGIVALKVDCIHAMNEQDLPEICRLLPGLTELSAHYSFVSLSSGAIHLFKLRNLQKLRLSACGLVLVLDDDTPTTLELRTLDLYGSTIMRSSIVALLRRTPRLQELHLGDCDIVDSVLAHICPLVPQLRVLSLVGAEVGDMELRGIRRLKRLERLDLRFCQRLTNGGVVASVRPLCRLRVLDLRNCTKVSSGVQARIRKSNPNITHLLVTPLLEDVMETNMACR